jgi:hypothetical protein
MNKFFTFFRHQVARSSEIMYSLVQQRYIITSSYYGQLLNSLENIASTLRHLAINVMSRKHKPIEKMTVEKLKCYPGLENLNDQEAKEILLSLEKLANILFTSLNKSSAPKE